MKIHAKIDYVLAMVLKLLDFDIPNYAWEADPLLSLSIPCGHDEPTISIPKLFREKFQQLSRTNGVSSNELSIKSESESDSDESKLEVNFNSIGDSQTQNAVSSTPDEKSTPSWFGKGLKLKSTSSKYRKRKGLFKT